MNFKPLQLALAGGALALGAALLGAPAANATQSGTSNGCYAEWYNTYVAGRCFNSKGSDKRLFVDCSWGNNHYFPWRYINGTLNPIDDMECNYGINDADVMQRDA